MIPFALLFGGSQASAVFINASKVANGSDTQNRVPYGIPSAAQIGDVVAFLCISNAQGNGSLPPGSGWTSINGSLGGGDSFQLKQMMSSADLSAMATGSGGYLGFVVYRGVVSFSEVSTSGYTKASSNVGTLSFAANSPNGFTGRITLVGNGRIAQASISDVLPPAPYANGSNIGGFAAAELRNA